MNIQKPHFWYNKSQRNGVFLLLLAVLILQVVYVSLDTGAVASAVLSKMEVAFLERQIDSLKQIEKAKRTPKIYPFNPNYVSDDKASILGLSLEEIDRLLLYRGKGNFINSAKQFQQVTGVSDSLLEVIAPKFKFPAWIALKRNKKERYRIVRKEKEQDVFTAFPEVLNINTTTAQDLETIDGVDYFLAKRIIAYRKRIQGFAYKNQLLEVWKLDQDMATKIWGVFQIGQRPSIQKININTASFKEVLAIPYVDFRLCQQMFDYRDEVAELQSIEELKNIDGFPLDKYDRIVLYLEAK